MKTAISLPDSIFVSADNLARKLGISRSRLYATAVAEFVARNKASRVTERLNAVYGAAADGLDDWGRNAAEHTLRRTEWK